MIDVTDTHWLQCQSYKPSPNGEVSYYLLEATPKETGEMVAIRLKPDDFVSARKFKIALLNRCIFYTASKREHDANVNELFSGKLRIV